MTKLNWKRTLEKLLAMPEDNKEFDDAASKAGHEADTWRCCSLAQRMIGIDACWRDISSEDRYTIVQILPDKLVELGEDFSHAVNETEYEEALEIHEQIQTHPFNEPDIKAAMHTRLQ